MTKSTKIDPVLIKKYSNRRLYNTEISNYITLEDLFIMVKNNVDFVVCDAKTGEDLTKNILTQIIFEQEGKGYSLLPIDFLKLIITYYGSHMNNLLPCYLDTTMRNFAENHDKIHQTFTKSMKQFVPLNFFEEMAKQNMTFFNNAIDVICNKHKQDNKDKF